MVGGVPVENVEQGAEKGPRGKIINPGVMGNLTDARKAERGKRGGKKKKGSKIRIESPIPGKSGSGRRKEPVSGVAGVR